MPPCRQKAQSGLLLFSFLAVFTGCTSGSRGTADVGGVVVAAKAGGDVPVEFVLVDPQSDPTDIEFRISADNGQSWLAGTARTPTTALATSPSGVRHTLIWDSIADFGPRADQQVLLSIRSIETDSGLGSEPVLATATLQTKSAAADRVEAYMIYFGELSTADIAVAKTHDLVILYPGATSVTRAVVAEIQSGVDAADPRDDVIVLGYVNLGEDDRTIGLSNGGLLSDPRFTGNGTGPRVDPRGAGAAGQPLTGLDPLGLPSVSGGYASFYLDDNSLESHGIGDGLPDRNGVTGACYVNAGDPAWFDALDAMLGASDGVPGLREILSLDYGAGYGFDGVCLDNIDTCSPNVWTGPGDPDQAEFEWTAAGYAAFFARLRTEYPKALVMQNRGLFFFNPNLHHYGLSTRGNIDFLKFESYRLDLESSREFDPYTFADNKFNFTPKLQAEAYRRDGFQVLSLGYAEGPGIEHDTLLGLSSAGMTTLLEDIVEAQQLAGFRHYLMDGGGQIVNPFVLENADFTDTTAPVWTSTYNANNPGYPQLPWAPNARVGIQEVVAGVESATLRWDVALDLNPVSYILYYDDEEFDFGDRDVFGKAERIVLRPEIGSGYDLGAGPNVYPYEAIISGLKKEKDYYFCIRAVDTLGNQDDNQVVLSVRTRADDLAMTVDGDFDDWKDVPKIAKDNREKTRTPGPDWKEIRVVNDAQNLYLYFDAYEKFSVAGAPILETAPLQIYLDVDNDPFTGHQFSNIGSELMVHGTQLMRQSKTAFDGGLVRTLTLNPTVNSDKCELAVPLADLDAAAGFIAGRIRLIFRNGAIGDLAPDSGYIEYRIAR